MKVTRIFSSVLCIGFLFMQDGLTSNKRPDSNIGKSRTTQNVRRTANQGSNSSQVDPNSLLSGIINPNNINPVPNINTLTARLQVRQAAMAADESRSSLVTQAQNREEVRQAQARDAQRQQQIRASQSGNKEAQINSYTNNTNIIASNVSQNSARENVSVGGAFYSEAHINHEQSAAKNASDKMESLINNHQGKAWYQQAIAGGDAATVLSKNNIDEHNDFISEITNISKSKEAKDRNYQLDPNVKPDMRVIEAAYNSLSGNADNVKKIQDATIDLDSIGKMKGLTEEEEAQIRHLFGKDEKKVTMEKVLELYKTIEYETVIPGKVHGVDISIPERQLEILAKVAAAHLHDQVIEKNSGKVFVHPDAIETAKNAEKEHMNNVSKVERDFTKLTPKESFLVTYHSAIISLPDDAAAYKEKSTETKKGLYKQSYDLMQAILNTPNKDYELLKMIRESTPTYVKHDSDHEWGGVNVADSEKEQEKILKDSHYTMMGEHEVDVNGEKLKIKEIESRLNANPTDKTLLDAYAKGLKEYVDSKSDGETWHMTIKDSDITMIMNSHKENTEIFEHVARNNYKGSSSGTATDEVKK